MDPRGKEFVKLFPNLTLAQERDIPLTVRRKGGPDIPPVPEDSVQRFSITSDSIKIALFKPAKEVTNLPVIIYYHGGAFVIPLQSWHERMYAFDMATKLNAIVFAVDYRVAPEYKFPYGVNDCFNAFKWLYSNAGAYGGDTSKIIVEGESAGAIWLLPYAKWPKQPV